MTQKLMFLDFSALTCRRIRALEERLEKTRNQTVWAIVWTEQGGPGPQLRVYTGGGQTQDLEKIHDGPCPMDADGWQELETSLSRRMPER